MLVNRTYAFPITEEYKYFRFWSDSWQGRHPGCREIDIFQAKLPQYIPADKALTRDLDIGGHAVKNIIAIDLNDAVNKRYVDTQLGFKFDKTVAADFDMRGHAVKNIIASGPNDAVNKRYVDTQLGLKTDKTYVDTEVSKKMSPISTVDLDMTLRLVTLRYRGSNPQKPPLLPSLFGVGPQNINCTIITVTITYYPKNRPLLSGIYEIRAPGRCISFRKKTTVYNRAGFIGWYCSVL